MFSGPLGYGPVECVLVGRSSPLWFEQEEAWRRRLLACLPPPPEGVELEVSASDVIDEKGLSYGVVAVVRRGVEDFKSAGQWLASAVELASSPIGWGVHLPSRGYANILLEHLGRVGAGRGGRESMRDIRIESAPQEPIDVLTLGWKIGEVLRALAEAAD
jgi:hypothetical protein